MASSFCLLSARHFLSRTGLSPNRMRDRNAGALDVRADALVKKIKREKSRDTIRATRRVRARGAGRPRRIRIDVSPLSDGLSDHDF
jgi:hypothetical protein